MEKNSSVVRVASVRLTLRLMASGAYKYRQIEQLQLHAARNLEVLSSVNIVFFARSPSQMVAYYDKGETNAVPPPNELNY